MKHIAEQFTLPFVGAADVMTKNMKYLTITDLNQVLVRKRGLAYAQGLVDLANLINALYPSATHTHLIGDAGLAKMNMLRHGKRVRRAVV